LPQSERLMQLNQAAIVQMTSLAGNGRIKKLGANGEGLILSRDKE